jgi:hypothetical protein
MMRKKIFIFGAGKRVVNDILPVLGALSDQFEIIGICNTRKKIIFDLAGNIYRTVLLNETDSLLKSADYVYLGVPPEKVKEVIEYIKSKSHPSALNLILDTPVSVTPDVIMGFNSVSVAEDIVYLPWIDLLPKDGLKKVSVNNAMIRYHGIAFLKKMFRSEILFAIGFFRTSLVFSKNGKFAVFCHPRDYGRGVLRFKFKNDLKMSSKDIEIIFDSKQLISGFKLRKEVVYLSESQKSVCNCTVADLGVVPNMLLIKRIALVTFFENLLKENQRYSHSDGYDDYVVDKSIHGKVFGVYVRFRAVGK